MSGIHQFTSSQWIQSGSVAQFKTGLEVSGSISATGTISAGTFLGDGSQLTGIADEDFFAGDPSFITASSPSSKDTFIALVSGNKTASATQVVIATTHSEDFTPNYYSFYKLTSDGFETVKSGSESFYSGSDRLPDDVEGFHPYENDLASGTHRYMVNAVDTSSGAGHSLFTTITVKGFVNRPPIIELPTNLTLSMDHDVDSKSITFELTGSTDTNNDDFIRRMSVTRSTVNPTAADSHRYNLLLENTSEDSDSESIATQSGEMGASTGLTSDGLTFTARLETYRSSHNTTHVVLPTPVDFTEVIHVTMSDNNQSNNTASNSFTFNIIPPPTASITNIRTQVESGSYTNTVGTYYEVPMLYDRATVPLNTSSLDDKYTESLVRIRTCANIEEPGGYTAASDHTTKVAIYENDSDIIDTSGLVHWVQMDGHAGTTYTASNYGSAHSSTNSPTESNGWIPLGLPQGNHYYGSQTSNSELLDIDGGVRHGSHNHFSASSGNPIQINVTAIPNVEISDIIVQVESSSFSEISATTRTGSVLYGYTASLLQEHTASLTGDKSVQYISESVIRYRVLARIQEPFGPDHRSTTVDIKTGGTSRNTIHFNTTSSDVQTSSSAFDGSNRLVTHYTSSWQSSSFDPGSYVISASFDNLATNADQTVTAGTYANLLVNQTESIQVNNIKVQVESSSYSQVPVYSRTGSILYGYTASLLEEHTASLNTYDRAVQYISESVIRYRVLAKVTEPFGPNHESTIVNLTNENGNHTLAFNTSSTDLFASGSTYIANRLVSTYTSSWQSSSFNVSTFTLSASFDTSSLSALMVPTPGNYSSLEMVQTGSTTISDMEVELETAYNTEVATNTRTSRILYGFTSSFITSETASLLDFDRTDDYISESVIRYRVRGKVTEPFGIETTDIVSSIVMGGSGGGGSIHEYLAVESFGNSDNIGTGTSNFRNVGTRNWTQNNSGGTTSGTTGPNNGISATSTASNSEAQSSGQGYIFTEATSNFSKVFTLRTPQLNLDQSTTNEKLVFYFHIKGDNISSEPLEIYHGTSETSIGSTELSYTYFNGSSTGSGPITAQTHANQSDAFYRLECDISAYRSTGGFYLYIRSLTGGNFSSDVAIDNVHVIGTSGGGGSTETLTFTTASSADIATTGSEAYTADHQRILNYTSSWQEYNFDNNIDLSSSFATTENILEVGTSVTSALTMSATVDPIIHSTMSYENKWTNETPSGTDTAARSATLLHGYTSSLLSAETASILTGETNYRVTHSTDAIIRHRIKAFVEEPFGPNTTAFTISPNSGSSFELSMTSSVTASSTVTYKTNTSKSLIQYTSSWMEATYETASAGGIFATGYEVTQSYIITSDIDPIVTHSADSPTLLLIATQDHTISILSPFESGSSGSGVDTHTRSTTYVHGIERTTVTEPADQALWPEEARNQMVRGRMLFYITESFGPRADTFTLNSYNVGSIYNNNIITLAVSSSSGFNHSESNGRFSYTYTSSFEPLEYTTTPGTTGRFYFVNATSYRNYPARMLQVSMADQGLSALTLVNRQTSSITINSITPYASHWSGSSGIVTLDPYIVSSNGTPTINDRILNISVNINPPDISSYTSMDSDNYTITWTDTSSKINANGDDIGYVDLQNINTYTALKTNIVSVEVASDIDGDSGVANSTQTINVLPYNPISMASAAITDNITLATAYLPSSSTWNYDNVNQIGTQVSNIFRTWNGSANDYSLTLSFFDDFNHAESGSLILLINGSNSCSIDLESLFDEASKASNQTLPTVGPLSLTTWGVHNNISQPIYDGTELYPVGYQKFTPQITFTEKLPNDGYNTVQLKRTGIPGADQLSDLYGFYYDDGAGTASIDAPTPNIWTWNESNSTSPTMSLSGVSYFVGGIPFEISYSGHIEGLASDTYPQPELVRLTTPTGLGLDFDGSYVTNQTNKGIDINSGLSWETGSTDPTINDVANISLMAKFAGNSISGVTKSIDIEALSKNATYTDTSTAAVGRFVNTGSIDSNPDSDTVANFYREDMRIPSSSNLNTLLAASQADYEYWLTSSNYTYDSTQSLLENDELQQTVDGHLIYPNANYTGSNIFNPNAPDYTDASGDRYWYRAIKVQGISGVGDKVLKVKIGVDQTDPITQADIYAHNPSGGGPVGFDTLPIRIRCKMPGPINADGGQDGAGTGDVGSNWSAICGGLSLPSNASVENWFISDSTQFIPESTENGFISIIWDCGNYAIRRNNDVCIIEVRMQASATQTRHHIKSIEILDV